MLIEFVPKYRKFENKIKSRKQYEVLPAIYIARCRRCRNNKIHNLNNSIILEFLSYHYFERKIKNV